VEPFLVSLIQSRIFNPHLSSQQNPFKEVTIVVDVDIQPSQLP